GSRSCKRAPTASSLGSAAFACAVAVVRDRHTKYPVAASRQIARPAPTPIHTLARLVLLARRLTPTSGFERVKEAPQPPQNLAAGVVALPHVGHAAMWPSVGAVSRTAAPPQTRQNFFEGG